MPQSSAQARIDLNDLNDRTRRYGLGNRVVPAPISGTHNIGAAADGGPFSDNETRTYWIDHAAEGSFGTAEQPVVTEVRFTPVPGFRVSALDEGKTASGFRFEATYYGEDYVYEYGSDYGAVGTATVSWQRIGPQLIDP